MSLCVSPKSPGCICTEAFQGVMLLPAQLRTSRLSGLLDLLAQLVGSVINGHRCVHLQVHLSSRHLWQSMNNILHFLGSQFIQVNRVGDGCHPISLQAVPIIQFWAYLLRDPVVHPLWPRSQNCASSPGRPSQAWG